MTFIKAPTNKTTLLLVYLAFGYLVCAHAYNLKGKLVEVVICKTKPGYF